ncbi:MAG: FGGY family carbohydrate kinase, partial [Acidimicrobiales bacterium]
MSVTVGIDIGTTAVKAVATDDDGTVVASARVPHRVLTPASDRLEHDADLVWRRAVRRAYRSVSRDVEVVAASVVAMVPSLTAVDGRGRPVGPGLLYGDARGAPADPSADPSASGELVGFVRWLAAERPDAAGYWPAQAVANHALCGRPVIDGAVAFCALPLFDGQGWDEAVATAAGARVEQLPDVVGGSEPIGRTADGAVLGPGTVDALAAQLVAGADNPGDVLVLCGATLITWVVAPGWVTAPGLWTVPHTAPGMCLVGGPSNAGGLFLDWAVRRTGPARREPPVLPADVPVWLPYARGERTPLYRSDLRAELHDAHLAHGPAAIRRAAYE